MPQSIPLRAGLRVLRGREQNSCQYASKNCILEHSEDAPRTACRPATLGYHTPGSCGIHDEIGVCGREAASKRKRPVSPSNDANTATTVGGQR